MCYNSEKNSDNFQQPLSEEYNIQIEGLKIAKAQTYDPTKFSVFVSPSLSVVTDREGFTSLGIRRYYCMWSKTFKISMKRYQGFNFEAYACAIIWEKL